MKIHMDSTILSLRGLLTMILAGSGFTLTDDPEDAAVILRWYALGSTRPYRPNKTYVLLLLRDAQRPANLPENVLTVNDIAGNLVRTLQEIAARQ